MGTESLRETIGRVRSNWARRSALWVRAGRLRRRMIERRVLGQLVRGLERMQARIDRRLSDLASGPRSTPPHEGPEVAPVTQAP